MSTEKLMYGRLAPERGTRGRRERTGGLPGSWVALLLGAGAVVASAAVVAVILQNIGHEIGDLRARVERGQEDVAKLQARADSAEKDLKEAQARAERDLSRAERDLKEVQARAERDLKEIQARAERDQSKLLQEIISLRERVVVLESFPPSHIEKQTSDTGPVSYPEGDSGDINTGVQSRNDTLGGHLYRHKREVPNANWVRLPASTCQAGRDGRDGIPGASGLQGPPGQKGDLGQPGTKGARGAGAKGAKGDTGLQGSRGEKGAKGDSGHNVLGAKGAKGDTGLQGSKGQKGSQGASGNNGGAVYVRWGRKTCPSGGATIVYSGVAGGTHHSQTGGGTNYQCLPTDPQWGRYQDGVHGTSAYMYGAQYRTARNVPFGSTYLNEHDVPCAVCYVPTRGSKLMIPARNTCYSGWTEEYDGYLMASWHSHSATEYVCVDDNPETVPGGQDNQNGARFYPVEARCGALPCPNYVEGRELTCVVCTK